MKREGGRSQDSSQLGKKNNGKTAAKIANHAWSHNHDIDFDNAFIIDKGNYHVRKFLESWHAVKTPNVGNTTVTLAFSQGNIAFF